MRRAAAVAALAVALVAGSGGTAQAASTMSGYPKCADAKVGQRCEIGGGIVLTKGGKAVKPPSTYGGFVGYVTLSPWQTRQVGYGDAGIVAGAICKKTTAGLVSCLLGANRYFGSIAATARKATDRKQCLRFGVFQAAQIPIPVRWAVVPCR